MSQHTYNANFVHCIFSTKDRKNTIPAAMHESLWAYLLGIANHLKLKTIAIGGSENHSPSFSSTFATRRSIIASGVSRRSSARFWRRAG
jgi:hypothetical protein